MIEAVGNGIVSFKRIEKLFLKNGTKFVEKILENREIAVFEAKPFSKKIEFLAGRFAAKEAIIKALKHKNKKINFTDIYIQNNEVLLSCCLLVKIHISIAHDKEYAIAVAIAERV